jgi:glutamate synthase (NADPH/NADH) large chain
VGRNFAAGMTGGVAYVWDPEEMLERMVADAAPSMRRLVESEAIELRVLLEEHVAETTSAAARRLLVDWQGQLSRFWVLRARGPEPGDLLATAPAGERAGV